MVNARRTHCPWDVFCQRIKMESHRLRAFSFRFFSSLATLLVCPFLWERFCRTTLQLVLSPSDTDAFFLYIMGYFVPHIHSECRWVRNNLSFVFWCLLFSSSSISRPTTNDNSEPFTTDHSSTNTLPSQSTRPLPTFAVIILVVGVVLSLLTIVIVSVRCWRRTKRPDIQEGATGRVERIELRTMTKEKAQDDDAMSVAESVASLLRPMPTYWKPGSG
jgi:hypothetical protein